ncbi:hypothetical protein ABZ508_32930 [Streptomyces lavendulocolor]|uniref:Uncharacterized protein n=1 Tax=Streptomyces lavendulocolor TaxID=67316 RepID=A0ABV2WFS4_9ACTN
MSRAAEGEAPVCLVIGPAGVGVHGADHEHPGPRPDRRYAELVGGPLDGRACCSA